MFIRPNPVAANAAITYDVLPHPEPISMLRDCQRIVVHRVGRSETVSSNGPGNPGLVDLTRQYFYTVALIYEEIVRDRSIFAWLPLARVRSISNVAIDS
jgi:hypothetical protein